MNRFKKIIISRTDSIGDVILTLPLAGFLKQALPGVTLLFLGKNYTRDVVNLCKDVDQFVSWDEINKLPNENEKVEFIKTLQADTILHVFPRSEIARLAARAKITTRIGSTGRLYHFSYCNKLVLLSRKNSLLHESQLNFKLLKPLVDTINIPSLEKMASYYHLRQTVQGEIQTDSLINPKKFNLVLHPKSKGSAREWPLNYYTELIRKLPQDRFKVFVTGTQTEGELIRDFLNENKGLVVDLTGKFSLSELISFIKQSDGLVAASTGPLHLAAMLGILAIGIYPPIKPMHPQRWAPIGKNAHFLVAQKDCEACRNEGECKCMNLITANQVSAIIEKYATNK